jgi:hypothetical protein
MHLGSWPFSDSFSRGELRGRSCRTPGTRINTGCLRMAGTPSLTSNRGCFLDGQKLGASGTTESRGHGLMPGVSGWRNMSLNSRAA